MELVSDSRCGTELGDRRLPTCTEVLPDGFVLRVSCLAKINLWCMDAFERFSNGFLVNRIKSIFRSKYRTFDDLRPGEFQDKILKKGVR